MLPARRAGGVGARRGAAIDKASACRPSSGQAATPRGHAARDMQGVAPMRDRIVVGSLGLALAAALTALLPGPALAKTLVYCSEGSPEGFDPALYTAGTTFDALAPGLQPPGRVRARHHQSAAGLAESWEVSDDGLSTPSTCARASSSTPPRGSRRRATSTRTTWCSPSSASGRPINPSTACRAARANTSVDVDARPAAVGREGRRPYRQVQSDSGPRRRSSPTSRWTSPRSCRPSMPTRCPTPARPSC